MIIIKQFEQIGVFCLVIVLLNYFFVIVFKKIYIYIVWYTGRFYFPNNLSLLTSWTFSYLRILAKHLSSSGFLSPFGGAAPSAPRLGRLRRLFGAALDGGKREKKLGRQQRPIILRTSAGSWGFRICAWFWNWTTGKWFLYRTNRQTHRIMPTSSTVL